MRSRLESLGVSVPRGGLRRPRSLDLAVRAGRACLQGSHYTPSDVEVLINAGVYRDNHTAEPAFACYIQDKLGINVEFQGRQTLSFDLQNGAVGLLSAVHVLDTMLHAGQLRVGMAISSEANTDKKPDPSWSMTPSGAALMLDVSPHADRGLGEFVFAVDDDKRDALRSAVRLDRARGRLLIWRDDEVETTWLQQAPSLVEQILQVNGLVAGDIDAVAASQPSARFVDDLARTVDLDAQKFARLELGDTHSTSWALAFHQLEQRGLTGAGQRVLILAFGSGLTAGGVVYHC